MNADNTNIYNAKICIDKEHNGNAYSKIIQFVQITYKEIADYITLDFRPLTSSN